MYLNRIGKSGPCWLVGDLVSPSRGIFIVGLLDTIFIVLDAFLLYLVF